MRGYFKINIKFLGALLFVLAIYVSYLYFFRAQAPDPFRLRANCTEEERITGTAKANLFFEEYFDAQLAQDPEWQSRLGIKDNYDKWTSMTEGYYNAKHLSNQTFYIYLNDSIILCECLDEAAQLSAKLLKGKLALEIEKYEYRYHTYPVNQMYGVHTTIPNLLINTQKIDSASDALAYIARVNAVPQKIDELIEQLKLRAAKNIILPQFLFPKVLESIENIIGGTAKGKNLEDNVIYKNFYNKLNKIKLEKEKDLELKWLFGLGLQERLLPAYQKLHDYLLELQEKATNKSGVWKLDDGANFYALKLKEETTTNLSPEEVYQLGLDEVARIHTEMKAVMEKVKFEGGLQDFFKYMREDEAFYYPNTEEGKAAYLADATALIDTMRTRLDNLFITKPEAKLIVKAVEVFRAKSAGKAFYQSPAPDGSRPGTYYANTYDMGDMPKYQMEALAYHEAIPGHHMQLSIAQELKEIPTFRRLAGRYTAYIEGWGLYSEYLPKEMGFYQDPYSDFGRLAMELWRACRLVVDVGLHYEKWNRQEAIDYYKKNTPNTENDCIKMVERHIVMPAQATTYKVGMIIILELKNKVKKDLGEQFDIKEFHEVLLTNGAVPLDVLQDLIEDYISSKKIKSIGSEN
jgi:uncharacterized protein (DUF885 family)